MTLTADAVNAILTVPAVRFDVMFRPGGGRWKKVGTASSFREGLALVNAEGDWWFRRCRSCSSDGPSLFDDFEREQEVPTAAGAR